MSIWQDKYKALEELEENIKLRASEVDFKIRKIQDALLEWHAASQIVSDNCQTSVLHAADKFYNWHQVVPTLSCWLANEARVRSTIYATASMVGINEELLAQKEVKQHLQVIFIRTQIPFRVALNELDHIYRLFHRIFLSSTTKTFHSKVDSLL